MAWADLMRIQLGGLMSAFAVTDARDRPQLKRLLEQTKKCVSQPLTSLAGLTMT
jgi:hypothetical protein